MSRKLLLSNIFEFINFLKLSSDDQSDLNSLTVTV